MSDDAEIWKNNDGTYGFAVGTNPDGSYAWPSFDEIKMTDEVRREILRIMLPLTVKASYIPHERR